MNVGSILNGEAPAAKEERPTPPQRHLINDLLNATPRRGKEGLAKDLLKQDPESTLNGLPAKETNKKEESKARDEPQDVKKEPKSAPRASKEEPKSAPHLSKEPPQAAPPESSPQAPPKRDLGAIIRGPSRKPKRYETPPVWAREWTPPGQKAPQYPAGGPAAGLSSKSIFNRAQTQLVDLECSVTGVIPAPLVVRTIAEWIYAHFTDIALDNRPYVELELKFGTIIDKMKGQRLDIGVSTECVFTRQLDIVFEMGVHEVGWNDMRKFLEELERAHQEEQRKAGAKPRRKFSVLESDLTDLFYHQNERNEQQKTVRVSRDNALLPPRHVAILKKRLLDLYVHNPLQMYDLRLSLLLEFPVPESSIEPLMAKNKPVLTRGKKRVSFKHQPTVTQFDLTRVLKPKPTKNKAGRTVIEQEQSFETELEVDVHELFGGFDKIRDGLDTIRFEELVEVFINNARVLNNRVTKLASH